ncbi:hypothetical protein DSM19430T_21460 [Desulfovibrio psychrotolerans]|uniref:Response regulator n=2 Tax=Desulfovibrio psychrotolerans TaxID=415242 RepID=A0A7J0BWC0_9BACT|nr:hypothetical protein DSM19430T_21460 [Desulfovibrio psychrotolerans]
MSVLLVEDSRLSAQAALCVLRRAGADTEWTDSGKAALDAFRLREFDMVIMDLSLPDMDGYAVARRMRAQRSKVFLLACTASRKDAVHDACLQAGFEDVLGKPLTRSALERVLRQMAGLSGGQDTVDGPVGDVPLGASETSGTSGTSDKSGAVCDVEAIMREMGISRDEYGSLLGAVSDVLKHYREEVLRLYEQGAISALVGSAHRIKGECAAVGAFRANGYAGLVEEAAGRNDDAPALQDAVAGLVAALDELADFARSWR